MRALLLFTANAVPSSGNGFRAVYVLFCMKTPRACDLSVQTGAPRCLCSAPCRAVYACLVYLFTSIRRFVCVRVIKAAVLVKISSRGCYFAPRHLAVFRAIANINKWVASLRACFQRECIMASPGVLWDHEGRALFLLLLVAFFRSHLRYLSVWRRRSVVVKSLTCRRVPGFASQCVRCRQE